MELSDFQKLPLMGIVRGISEDKIEPLIEASIKGGLKIIEIAMNTNKAPFVIKKAKKICKGKMFLGAGTVLSGDDLALSSGAEFIVMPVIIEEIIKKCLKRNIPVFPGALTPNEVFRAWQYGASMVKVFPSRVFGPSYIKELKGPLDKIKLMAVGGVSLEKVKDFFDAGADAVAFGSGVYKEEWIDKGDFSSIEKLIKDYVREVKDAHNIMEC